MFSRKNLQPEQAYHVTKDDTYFWTPDGVSGFWYDTKAEMEEQHGGGRVITITDLED